MPLHYYIIIIIAITPLLFILARCCCRWLLLSTLRHDYYYFTLLLFHCRWYYIIITPLRHTLHYCYYAAMLSPWCHYWLLSCRFRHYLAIISDPHYCLSSIVQKESRVFQKSSWEERKQNAESAEKRGEYPPPIRAHDMSREWERREHLICSMQREKRKERERVQESMRERGDERNREWGGGESLKRSLTSREEKRVP